MYLCMYMYIHIPHNKGQFYTCALGVLNDYVLYKSTHSLTCLCDSSKERCIGWGLGSIQGRGNLQDIFRSIVVDIFNPIQ